MKSKENYLNLIKNNPVQIGRIVGFKDLTELHNEWLKLVLFSNEDETIQAHRGSYKTSSCCALGIALLSILRPTKTIGFFRKTDPAAKEVIKLVGKLLNADVFKIIAYAIYETELTLIEENANNITTNLFQATKGSSQIEGSGIQTTLTGRHYDYIFTDDIVTKTDRQSRAEREFTKSVYMELQNIKNRGGLFRNTGTPWHKDDAFNLMPPPHKYDCYVTGLISREELEKLRNSMTNSLFAANYELRHIASDDVIFTEPKFESQIEKIYDGICHLDASYGGDDGTAFTIIKKHKDGSYTAFGKRWEKHVDKCLNDIMILRNKYRAGTISCETNSDKGYLAEKLEGLGFNVDTYHEKMNKFVKISTHLKGVWSNMEWLEDTDPEFINEILDYNEQAEHDDCPDSAASLVRRIEEAPQWGW